MKELLEALRSKNRDAVAGQVETLFVQFREWLQEHGEWALAVGIVAGIVFVLFFKVIVLLVVLGGLASYVIWQLTLEDNPTGTFMVDEQTIDVTDASSIESAETQQESEEEAEKDSKSVTVKVDAEQDASERNGHVDQVAEDEQKNA